VNLTRELRLTQAALCFGAALSMFCLSQGAIWQAGTAGVLTAASGCYSLHFFAKIAALRQAQLDKWIALRQLETKLASLNYPRMLKIDRPDTSRPTWMN